MNETIKKLRTILLDMITRQFKTSHGIDNRINLSMVEVQFIKDVVITLCAIACFDLEVVDEAEVLYP